MMTAVVPIITVYDTCDETPVKEYVLNGQPYEFGTPITGAGLYFLNLRAEDASGNENYLSVVFEIRTRPSHTVAAVVENTTCELDQEGVNGTISARILISSAELDHRQFLLSSMRTLLRKADGTYYNTAPIPVKGGITPGCERFRDELAVAEIDDCVIVIEIESNFFSEPPGECPAQLVILGVGVVDGAIAYEWGTATTNVADPQARQTLLDQVEKEDECGESRPPAPLPLPPGCVHIETPIYNPGTCPGAWAPAGAPCGAGSGTISTAWVNTLINGRSNSVAVGTIATWPCATASMCSAQDTTVLIEQLVGNCCDCVFTYSVNASVTAGASVTGFMSFNGSASANGRMTFTAPCDSTFIGAVATASVLT